MRFALLIGMNATQTKENEMKKAYKGIVINSTFVGTPSAGWDFVELNIVKLNISKNHLPLTSIMEISETY